MAQNPGKIATRVEGLKMIEIPRLILIDTEVDSDDYQLDWLDFKLFPDAEVEEQIQSQQFNVPAGYLAEITRCSQQAKLEWGYPRSFDTSIRDMCLQPAIAYIQVAMKLIAACTSYTTSSFTLYYAMLYKLWMGQTGSGVVRHHADLKSLEKWTDSIWSTGTTQQREDAKKFLKKIEDYENSLHGIRV